MSYYIKNRMSFFDMLRETFQGSLKKKSFKIALIGDGSTGKTSYFNRISLGEQEDYKFEKKYDATQGCNICQIEFSINKNPVTLHLFDTAGQEKFGAMRDSYLLGVDGVIVLYDVSEKSTRSNVLTKWIPEIRKILSLSDETSVPIMVVGNKNDKIANLDNVYENIGLRVSTLSGNYRGPINHCFTSVKADENLMEPINWLLKTILSTYCVVNVERSKKKPVMVYCNKN